MIKSRLTYSLLFMRPLAYNIHPDFANDQPRFLPHFPLAHSCDSFCDSCMMFLRRDPGVKITS